MAQNPSSPQERIISIPWSHLIRLFWLNLFGHKNRKWLRCVAPWELPPFIRCESIVKPMASWTRLSLYHALTASSSMVVSCGAAPYLWGISWFFSHTNKPSWKSLLSDQSIPKPPQKTTSRVQCACTSWNFSWKRDDFPQLRASQFSLRAPKGRGHRIRQQIGITTNVTSHDGGQKHIYI